MRASKSYRESFGGHQSLGLTLPLQGGIEPYKECVALDMVFLAEQSGSADSGDRVWIHPDGVIAALVDGVSGCSDPGQAARLCAGFLESQDDNALGEPEAVLQNLHRFLATQEQQAVIALVRVDGDQGHCYWVGNPSLTQFTGHSQACLTGEAQSQPTQVLGQPGQIAVQSTRFQLGLDRRLLLASDGLSVSELLRQSGRVLNATSREDFRAIANDCQTEKDWSFLVFPIEAQFSFARSTWPYNPFVGPQEDRAHERRGLAALADALFSDPDFEGFRIFGGLQLPSANASRLPDGVLVSAWGVVLLELKDHSEAQIELPLTNRSPMMVYEQGSRHGEGNPVAKLRESLRSFQEFKLGDGAWDPRLARLGAVVFTHETVSVTAIDEKGPHPLPLKSGEVLVVRPDDLPLQLKRFVRRELGKKNRRPLESHIEDIVRALAMPAEVPERLAQDQAVMIGEYRILSEPIVSESTDYYQTVEASHPQLGNVWIKIYNLSQIGRKSVEEESQRIAREVTAIKRLKVNRVEGIQDSIDTIPEDQKLYVVVSRPRDSVRLDEWLAQSPDRDDRWKVLIALAGVLEGLADNQVVHRALTPANIRIGRRCKVEVLNFELCQMDQLATLPMSGRRALDLAYIASEANVPGRAITPATDMYSFGRLLTLLLSGTLPFKDYTEQRMAERKPGFWENIAETCGLNAADAEVLKQWHSQNPARRPTPDEAIRKLEEWKSH